jgi:hypothetical protein
MDAASIAPNPPSTFAAFNAAFGSPLPSPDEVRADPDLILRFYDCCPKCGSTHLEALTWKSIGSDDVTVGCWECDWMIHPPQWQPPENR